MQSVEDIPSDLVKAIYQGNRVLDWQENLSEEEMPPQWMWIFEEELQVWFERIAEDRTSKYGGNSSDDEPAGEMMQNELAAGRRG